MFTVADLITLLQTVDPQLEVGRIGHYGEFFAMDQYDFRTHTAWCYAPHWYNVKDHTGFEVFAIYPPEIGDAPD